jgi:hypothetical protein
MPLQVEFDIPTVVYEAAESEAAWQEVQKYSTFKLLMYLKRWVKSKGWTIQIKKCPPKVAGEHFVSEGEINIDIGNTWAETPAILTHEILHGLFYQLAEDKILILERKILKEASSKQICTLVHTIFKYGNWKYVGPYSKRV